MKTDSIATQPDTSRPQAAMVWFVSLSLLLHLVILVWANSRDDVVTIPAAMTRSAPLAIHMVTRGAQSDKEPVRKEARNRVTHQARNTPHKNPVRAVKTPTPVPAETPGQVSGEEVPAEQKQNAVNSVQQENIRLTLQQEITRYFSYPTLARRRGWQGEVVLAFRLEADGTIMNARIARSSGYGVLDRAALHALGKLKRLNHTLQHDLDMQLPVIYRLKEG